MLSEATAKLLFYQIVCAVKVCSVKATAKLLFCQIVCAVKVC